MTTLFHDSEAFIKGKDWIYRPSYDNANDVKLVCIRKEGNKKSKFFNLEKQDANDVRKYIEKQIDSDFYRGKGTIVINHFWNYDICYLTKGERENTDRWEIMNDNPFIAEFRMKLTEEEKERLRKTGTICSRCKKQMEVTETNDYYIQLRCKKCGKNKKNSKKARLIDSMNFFKMSLKRLGEIIGHKKMEMPKETSSIEEIKKYCENDVIILEKAWKYLKESLNKLGYVPKNLMTISKLGYNLLQFVCSKTPYKNHTQYSFLWKEGSIRFPTKEEDFIKMACRGGRLERFSLQDGVQIGNKIDINSCYPYVCVNNPFPDPKTEKVIEYPNEKDLNKIGCSEVTIKSPCIYVGYLPITYNKRRIYPNSTIMRAVWTNHEIKYAIEKLGYELIEMHKSVVYEEMPFNFFKTFYEKLYKIKTNNRDNMAQIVKMIMNSTTGKFIQKNKRKMKKVTTRNNLRSFMAQGYKFKTDIPNTDKIIMEKEYEEKLSKNAHPIIYAHITAYARTYLYENLIKIKPTDLLYCATDSILFKNKENIKKFEIGEEMGQWKSEATDMEIEFVGNETFYRIGNEIKANGIRRGTVDMESLRRGTNIQRKHLYTLKMALKTGEFEKVGSFIKEEVSLKGIPRRKIKYPPYIEETTKSRMISMMDTLTK